MSLALNGTNGITYNDGSLQPSAPVGKNLIINGNMQIAQRATSVTGISTGGGYRTIDRFFNAINATGTWTESQDTDVPTGQGFATSLKMDCTTANASLSAGSYALAVQYIEGFNCQQLGFGTANAKSITMSFWVKSNKTGTYIFDLINHDASRSISQIYTISVANTWEKKTLTFAGDTAGAINNDNGRGLQCTFWIAAGSDYSSGTLQTSWAASVSANRAVGQVNLADSTANYINITGVQLEANTTATPFEHLQYEQQLALCQRYYFKSANGSGDILSGFGEIYNTANGQVPFYLPVPMRIADPSYSVQWQDVQALVPSTGGYTVTTIAIANGTYNTVLLNFVSSGMTAGKNPYLRTSSVNGYIAISGEL